MNEQALATAFGEQLKRFRLRQRWTLRGFCKFLGVDPANYSRMERGLLPPPAGVETLDRWADILLLSRAEHRELLRLADLSRGRVPRSALTDEETCKKLPAIFRALDDKKADALIEAMRTE